MKSAINRLPVFYRYLLSYIVLLLLPLLFLGTTGYLRLADIVGNEVERNNQALLDKLQDEVDQKLIQMNKIAGQITQTPELSPYVLTHDTLSMYEGKKVLESKVVDDSIREILLNIRGTDYLYSSLSVYKVKDFVTDFYHYSDWNGKQFSEDLNSLSAPLLRPAEDVKIEGLPFQRFITYLVPIPINSQRPYGTVMFMLKEDMLLKGLNPELTLPQGNAVVFDSKGQVLSAYKQEDYLKDPAFYKQLTEERGSSQLDIMNKPYAVTYQKSAKSGLLYVTMQPQSSVMAPVNRVIVEWINSLLIIFLAGSLLVYLVMLFNYKPVKRLASLVETVRGQSIRKANEFEAIGSVIHDMVNSNRLLGRKLEENRYAVKEHLLGSLLKGEMKTLEDMNERGKEVGIVFPNPLAAVMILEYPSSLVPYKDRLIQEVDQKLGGRYIGYSKDSLEDKRAMFILSVEGPPEEWKAWLLQLHEHLSTVFEAPITMGVGNVYAELTQVGRSYLEASTAIDYKLIRGSQRALFFDEMMAHHYEDVFNPRRVLDDLDIVLQHGSPDRISEEVQQIAVRMKQSGLTLFIARELCYDMIRKFIAVVEKKQPGSSNGSFPDVMALTDFTTLDEIADLFTTACATLCESLKEHKPASPTALIDQITQYIQNHYNEPDFSVQKIADHFSLSLSYLSRYFKEQTGRTVMDYLNEIRIDQAKLLLRTDDRSVKEIVLQVGYYDVSSFIRKFKQSVGVTPGEYRKQQRA
ncbi:hypothetical protein GCM10023310_51520 [Paenibacillus vulneris]|uniref:Helix-turn-helix domain-containing protein n=1 Tax=Paenibacillus vulneris TaxID=1133364 RepID=A0ABW3UJL4_9BACL